MLAKEMGHMKADWCLANLQAKKRSRASAILAAADARAADPEGAPAVVLQPDAVTIEAGIPLAEHLQLLNKGAATAVFSLAPAPVRRHTVFAVLKRKVDCPRSTCSSRNSEVKTAYSLSHIGFLSFSPTACSFLFSVCTAQHVLTQCLQ